MRLDDDITCAELVELVTDYLEGALSPELSVRFEEHLMVCEGCAVHVAQMQDTIRIAGSLREDDLAPEITQQLLEAFRGWRDATA